MIGRFVVDQQQGMPTSTNQTPTARGSLVDSPSSRPRTWGQVPPLRQPTWKRPSGETTRPPVSEDNGDDTCATNPNEPQQTRSALSPHKRTLPGFSIVHGRGAARRSHVLTQPQHVPAAGAAAISLILCLITILAARAVSKSITCHDALVLPTRVTVDPYIVLICTSLPDSNPDFKWTKATRR
jgi:hypothetical protein